MTRYRTIVADPPWPYEGTSVNPRRAQGRYKVHDMPYGTMSLTEIATLPIRELAESSAHLYCWTTQRYLEQTFQIVRAWGFRPACTLVWCKTPYGWMPGGTFFPTVEFVIYARRGQLPAQERCNRQWWEWKRGEHSAKPEAFLDIVEQVSPGPYLEMFARRQRLGWDTWGNEALEHVEVVA